MKGHIYYINDLYKSVLFITMIIHDVDDDHESSVNSNDSKEKYQYSHYRSSCTQSLTSSSCDEKSISW